MKDQSTQNYEAKIKKNQERQKELSAALKASVQEGKKLLRDSRTHRLCTIGAMVESYLIAPELLDPDDLKRVLDAFFSNERTQIALGRLLKEKEAKIGEEKRLPNHPGNLESDD